MAVASPGYRFLGWSGSFASKVNPATISIDCNKEIVASFVPMTPLLTIKIHGKGSTSPIIGDNNYPQGTTINLKATPESGWKFDGWSKNVDTPLSLGTTLTLNADTIVTANFSKVWPIWIISLIIGGGIVIVGAIVWLLFRQHSSIGKSVGKLLRSSYTSLLFRLILGGIFIFTGFAKVNHISALINEIKQYQILPYALASVYGHVLPYLEIVVGVLLVLGIVLRISASIAGLMLISFAVAKIVAIIRGLNISVCHCFGPAVPLLSNQSLAIDFIMLLLAIQIILFRNKLFSISSWIRRRNTHNHESRL